MASPPREIYLAHADLIERTISTVCRRHHLFGAEAEDFAGVARVHLIEDDYAVLRRFEGRSSVASYLIVVITRRFQDWRNARWGKWRPSLEARRLGDLAVRLETLTVRDGLSLDEAHELLRTHHGIADTRAALEALATRFPVRHKRSFVGDDAVATMPAPATGAEADLIARERAATARRATTAMAAAIEALPAQDRLILRMRFQDNLQVSAIAAALRLEAKPLYRRVEKILATLRHTLEASGLTADAVADALSAQGFDHPGEWESGGQVRLFPQREPAPALTGGPRD